MEHIKRHVEQIRLEIEKSAEKSGRCPEDITLMAVTKTYPIEQIEYARDQCGISCFGENRVQEVQEKFKDLHIPDELHLIGHLQTNKVKRILDYTNYIDSVDSIKLLEKVEKVAADRNQIVKILFEYNTSGEEAKSGFTTKDALLEAVEKGFQCKHIEMRGLMTVGPLVRDETMIRRAFSELRDLYFDVIKRYPEITFETISMGMSNDFSIAIEEGSNLVRIGSRIFGERVYG